MNVDAPNNSQNFNNSNMSWGQEAGSSSGYAPQPSMNNAQQYNQYNATPHVTPNSGGMGFGYASLVLGILSIITLCCCCGPIPGILAVVFGIIQIGRTPEKKGISIAGIVTGAIGILLSIIMYISFMTGVDYDNPAKDFYDDIYWNIQEELDKTNTDL